MKKVKNVILLMLALSIIFSHPSIALGKHIIKNSVRGVYYSDDFEEYTDGSGMGNDYGVIELIENGYLTVPYGMKTTDHTGAYARYSSIVGHKHGNQYLRLVTGQVKFRNPSSSDIGTFCKANNFDSLKVEFDIMFEALPTAGMDFQYRFANEHRFLIYFGPDGTVRYGTSMGSAPSNWAYIKNGDSDFTITPGEWYTLQIIFQNGELILKFADNKLDNGKLSIQSLEDAQYQDEYLFSENSSEHTAVCIDNVNIQGYQYVSPIIYEETFQNYSTNVGHGNAEDEINASNGGRLTVAKDGINSNYTGEYSRNAEVVTDNDDADKYLRIIASSATLESTDISKLITEKGYDSFSVEYDARYEGDSANMIQIRYNVAGAKIFYFKDGKVLYARDNTNIGAARELFEVNANEFHHFSYIYSNGILKIRCDNILADEIPYASLNEAVFENIYFENGSAASGLSLDNIKITGIVNSSVTVYSDSTFAAPKGCHNGNDGNIYGWGDALSDFFESSIAVHNFSAFINNTTVYDDISDLFVKNSVIDTVGEDDYLILAFGHTDSTLLSESEYPTAEEFKAVLQELINKVIVKGACPILITPLENSFSYVGLQQEYADMIFALAEENNIPCIDFAALFREYFTDLSDTENFHSSGRFLTRVGAAQAAALITKAVDNIGTSLDNYLMYDVINGFSNHKNIEDAEYHVREISFTDSNGREVYKVTDGICINSLKVEQLTDNRSTGNIYLTVFHGNSLLAVKKLAINDISGWGKNHVVKIPIDLSLDFDNIPLSEIAVKVMVTADTLKPYCYVFRIGE